MNKAFEIALKEYGQKEIVGRIDNPRILEYFDESGFDGSRLKDETAWCSAFVNWCCKKAGKPYTRKLNATSWLNVGRTVDAPELGDVVVFWRGKYKGDTISGTNLMKGHVAFFVRETNNYIYVLGGNQGNQVKISAYHKSRLLDYKRI